MNPPQMIIAVVDRDGLHQAANIWFETAPTERAALQEALDAVRHLIDGHGHQVDGFFVTPGIMRALEQNGMTRRADVQVLWPPLSATSLRGPRDWMGSQTTLLDGTPLRLMVVRSDGSYEAIRETPPKTRIADLACEPEECDSDCSVCWPDDE